MCVNYLLSQLCVLVAVIFFSATYLTKNHNKILLFTSIAALFYGLEYLLLGSLTGFVLNLIAILRGVFFFLENRYKKNASIFSLIGIEVLILLLGVLSWKSLAMSLIPIIANLLFTYAVWQKNNNVYRVISFMYSACWILFNIILLSVLGLVSEIVILIIEIVGCVKFYRRKTLTNSH